MTRYFFNTHTGETVQLNSNRPEGSPETRFSPDWVAISWEAFTMTGDTLVINNLIENLEVSLTYIDAWRSAHLGDGDIAAMNARAAIRQAKDRQAL